MSEELSTADAVTSDALARRGKRTADGVSVLRSLATYEPDEAVRNADLMARHFVDDARLIPGSEAHRLELVKIFETMVPGSYHYLNARTHFLDGVVRAGIASGTRQIVVLGAGYDTRAYRLSPDDGRVTFFEVDLPALQALKKGKIQAALGQLPDHVRYVPTDFNVDSVETRLLEARFDPALPTVCLWEGVTCYLSPEGVDATLGALRRLMPASSVLAFDVITRAMVAGEDHGHGAREAAAYVAGVGEPYTLGFDEDELPAFLSARGFRLKTLLGPEDIEARYLRTSNGERHGRVVSFHRLVEAEVL